jgi:hypothetical protein
MATCVPRVKTVSSLGVSCSELLTFGAKRPPLNGAVTYEAAESSSSRIISLALYS